jgi:P-type Cu+ transporter
MNRSSHSCCGGHGSSTAAGQLRCEGETVMFLAVEGRLAAVLAVGDPLKEGTPGALRALKEEGLRLVMLTGDSRTTALAIARGLPFDEVIAKCNRLIKRL